MCHREEIIYAACVCVDRERGHIKVCIYKGGLLVQISQHFLEFLEKKKRKIGKKMGSESLPEWALLALEKRARLLESALTDEFFYILFLAYFF